MLSGFNTQPSSGPTCCWNLVESPGWSNPRNWISCEWAGDLQRKPLAQKLEHDQLQLWNFVFAPKQGVPFGDKWHHHISGLVFAPVPRYIPCLFHVILLKKPCVSPPKSSLSSHRFGWKVLPWWSWHVRCRESNASAPKETTFPVLSLLDILIIPLYELVVDGSQMTIWDHLMNGLNKTVVPRCDTLIVAA